MKLKLDQIWNSQKIECYIIQDKSQLRLDQTLKQQSRKVESYNTYSKKLFSFI